MTQNEGVTLTPCRCGFSGPLKGHDCLDHLQERLAKLSEELMIASESRRLAERERDMARNDLALVNADKHRLITEIASRPALAEVEHLRSQLRIKTAIADQNTADLRMVMAQRDSLRRDLERMNTAAVS